MSSCRLALATLVAFAALVTPAAAAREQPPPWLELENGTTAPQFAFENAIEEVVFVETPLDTDDDGARDRIRIRISRPGETRTQGIKVPVVFEHSPYRGDFGNAVNHNVDFEFMPQESIGNERRRASAARARARARARSRADLPGSLDNYYVPRGYAVVLGESIGTFNSDGCPDIGGPWETLGTKAVIDWLNGRARGFDEAGNQVTADWTTGAVGMTGVSYNGTLPNQVATTGVEGLKTIIPVSAISSWYDYYRANGLVVAPHSEAQGVGDNGFLGEDTDVLADFIAARMTTTCADVRQMLVERQDRTTGIPRKIWLHNGGHGGPGPVTTPAGAAYKRAENRWFDHWLFGVQNGIMDEPRLTIQREDGSYHDEADWPAPGARTAKLQLSASSATAPGGLTTRPAGGREQSFIDRGRELDTDDVLIQNPDQAHPNRLVYRSPARSREVRLSGTPWVDLRMSIDNRNAANLTAVLVDYGPDGAATMVTRGRLDPQNRHRLDRSEAIRQGREYDFRWDLQPDDYVWQAGHRIGLVVVSTDHDYTIRPARGTKLTLDPAASEVRLPIVGGVAALGF